MLSACVTDGGSSNSGYYGRQSSYSGSSYNNSYDDDRQRLSKVQSNALETGCRERYAHDRSKYRQCLSGNRNFDDVMEDGCRSRYSGDRDKYRRCMAGNW